MKKVILLIGIFTFLMNSCSQEDSTPLNPSAASLISPANEETCFDGNSINDSQSNVDFRWSPAINALSYELLVTNLLTLTSQTFTSVTNQITIALNKTEPYSWSVKSIGEVGSVPSQSIEWKFYLAGDAIVNYAPFPPELISPPSGANVTPDINNLITLSWNASDVDEDIVKFKVYLDEDDATTLNKTLDYQNQEVNIEIEVANDTIYYWKIIAIDSNENESSSGVYAFRTN